MSFMDNIKNPNGLKLFGSTTSPYVRRLRILLQSMEHEFVLLDIFNSRDRAVIQVKNPTLKIPMLMDDDQVVLDSGNIFRYLSKRYSLGELSVNEQNVLTSIDAVNDGLVQMLILSRSEIDVSADKLYFRIQRERQETVFTHLEEEAKNGRFKEWNYLSISLFCLLDWITFRHLFDFSDYPTLVKLYQDWLPLPVCQKTDPRE